MNAITRKENLEFNIRWACQNIWDAQELLEYTEGDILELCDITGACFDDICRNYGIGQ